MSHVTLIDFSGPLAESVRITTATAYECPVLMF